MRRHLPWLLPALILSGLASVGGGWWGALLGFAVVPVGLLLLGGAINLVFVVAWCGLAGSRARFRDPRFWAACAAVSLAGGALGHAFRAALGDLPPILALARGLALGALLLPVASFLAGWRRGWRLFHSDVPGTWGWRE